MPNEFDIDPRNKLGNTEWENEDDMADFVAALGGDPSAIARLRARHPDQSNGGEVELDALSIEQLKSTLHGYR